MNGYSIEPDGNSHVNYSNLKRCNSPDGVIKVLQELKGQRRHFNGESVMMGKIRHSAWEAESKLTGHTPADFQHLYYQPVDFIEQEFAAEIFKGVILHFRPDTVSIKDCAVIDNKKVVKGAHKFMNDWQLKIYAYGLGLHGIRITKAVHLCEIWSNDKDEPRIIGYQALERKIGLSDMATARQWLRIRANYFVQAEKLLAS